MICKKCAHESYCDMAQFGGHEPPITACPKFKKKSQTNADRIRAMTDEALAKFIEYLTSGCDYMYPECYARKFCTSGGCHSAWLDWLKKEQ